MIDRQHILTTLDSLNDMSRDIDFGTFANLALYTLIVTAKILDGMPPALQVQAKHAIMTVVDEATGEVSPEDNRLAREMMNRLGLARSPEREEYFLHVALTRN